MLKDITEKLRNIAEDILVNLVVAIMIGLPIIAGIVTYTLLNQASTLGLVALIISVIAGILVFVVEIVILLAIP